MTPVSQFNVRIYSLFAKSKNGLGNYLFQVKNPRSPYYNLSTMNYSQRYNEMNVNPIKELMDYRTKRETCYEEYTSLGKLVAEDTVKSSSEHVQFKILGYNILAQTHMQHHLQLYRKCPRQCLNWSFRKCVLTREFEEIAPDIFCLQEVEETHKDELLEPWRKRGYGELYVWREFGKPDGCALLYNKRMFRVADHTPVNYWRPDEVDIMNRPNVGMVVKLELTQYPGNYLIVVNTHILYNPGREDIKLCQLILLLAELERMAYIPSPSATLDRGKYHPIILTGDLNVHADSGLIQLLTTGRLDSHTVTGKKKKKKKSVNTPRTVPTEQLESGLNLSLDGCQYLHVRNSRHSPASSKKTDENLEEQENSKTTKRTFSEDVTHSFSFDHIQDHYELDRNFRSKIKVFDYMFYSSERREGSRSRLKLVPGELRLLSRLRLPTPAEYHSYIRGIPNLAFGSDHIPLTATFLMGVSRKQQQT